MILPLAITDIMNSDDTERERGQEVEEYGVLCVFFTAGIIHELSDVRQRRGEDEGGEGEGEGENFWCK